MKKKIKKVTMFISSIIIFFIAIIVGFFYYNGSSLSSFQNDSKLFYSKWINESITKNIPCPQLKINDTKELNKNFDKIGYSGGIDYWCDIREINFFQNRKKFQNKMNGKIMIEDSIKIPKEISKLNNLYELSLYSLKIDGGIPKELGNLNNLRILKINRANLKGEIPKEIGKLNKLLVLSLFGNNLSGKIPKELFNLKKLIIFNLDENKLIGDIPNDFKYLQKY